MSAKDMFEKLGYEYNNYGNHIDYQIYRTRNISQVIDFRLDIKKIWLTCEEYINEDEKWISNDFEMTIELLQAINKQVEELGWDER